MNRWLRVFCTRADGLDAAALADCTRSAATGVKATVETDGCGCRRAELHLQGCAEPLVLMRYLRSEPGIVGELQSWAAWLETQEPDPHALPLMQHMISTQLVFTLDRPEWSLDSPQVDRLCVALCQFLARTRGGVYQVDGEGFFDEAGTLLVAEPEDER